MTYIQCCHEIAIYAVILMIEISEFMNNGLKPIVGFWKDYNNDLRIKQAVN